MNANQLFTLGFALLLSACATTPQSSAPASGPGPHAPATSSTPGSSFASAISVPAANERQGVAAEYQWVEKHYPGSRSLGQSLTQHDNKPYDILHIQTKDGKKRDVYFDISKFFGKF